MPMLCPFCKQEMSEGVSCRSAAFPIQGKDYAPIPNNTDTNCNDCQCPAGGMHHPGCDLETCPKCNGQLISCGCLEA